MKIFELFGEIFIDNTGADQSLDNTESKAKKIGTTLTKGIGTAAKWGGAILGGATVAGGAILAAGDKFAQTTDRIDKMSDKLGLTREGFQEWEFILSQSGSSIESMQAGMTKLNNNFDDLKKGTGTGAAAFEELGLSVEDLAGMTQEEIFETTVKALQEVEDESRRAALANDLLGKSGAELAPLLNAGAGAIDSMKQQAGDLGLVMTDEAIDAGVQYADTMDQLKRTFMATGTALMADLMPMIQGFLELIMDNMPLIQSTLESLFNAFSAALDVLMPLLTDMIEQLLPPLLDLFIFAADTVLPPLMELFTEFATLILPLVVTAFEALMPIIEPILNALSALIKAVVAAINGDWEEAWTQLLDFFSEILDAIMEILDPFIELFESAMQGLADVISGIWDGMVNGIKSAINVLINGINSFIGGINKLEIPDWVPKVGGLSLNLATIPLLADGGNITKGGAAIVGEAGPELLNLPQGARVTPLSGGQGMGTTITNEFNIDEMVIRQESDIKKVAKELYNMQRRNSRAREVRV